MNKKLLTRPFEPAQIKRRKGQHGKTLAYVDIAAVIARLNEAADSWSFDIVEHQIQAGEVIVLGRLTLDGVTKMAFGGSSITVDRGGEVVSVADDLKAASSDALKKAASLFGVGLELYGGAQNTAERPARSSPGRAEEEGEAPSRRSLPMAERVTARQLSAIHGACRRHGVSKDELGRLVRDRAGTDRLADLSKGQASELLSELSGSNGGAR